MSVETPNELMTEAGGLITSGFVREAATLLLKIDGPALSRRDNLEFAKLNRRVGLPDQSLRLLAPFVRPKEGIPHQPTDAEKAEYAFSLQRLGSLNEAREVLASVDAGKVPEKLLYEAIFNFTEWNYRDAIPILRQLIAAVPAGDYLSRVAQVNLAAALTFERQTAEASELLENLRRQTEAGGELMLLGNVCEITAQNLIHAGQFAPARAHLEAAEKLLKGVKVLDYLWIVKWRGILEALESHSAAPLEKVFEEALRKRHWETLRDLDFFRLKIDFDPAVFQKLYFGTSSPYYRRRLLETFPDHLVPGRVAVGAGWQIRSGGKGLDLFFDLKDDLAPGTLNHTVLILFISEWYRWFRPGELHAILFKGDYFNPDTSPNRVHQSILRLRRAVEENLPGAEIQTEDSVYALQLTGEIQIDVPQMLPEPQPLKIRLHALKAKLNSQTFGVEDVKSILGLTKSSANKLLAQWREDGLIQPTGSGKSTRYF